MGLGDKPLDRLCIRMQSMSGRVCYLVLEELHVRVEHVTLRDVDALPVGGLERAPREPPESTSTPEPQRQTQRQTCVTDLGEDLVDELHDARGDGRLAHLPRVEERPLGHLSRIDWGGLD